MNDVPPQSNAAGNNRLIEYKLEVITKNIDKLEGSLKELSGAISSVAQQQITRNEWNESQNTIKGLSADYKGLSIWRWMMAGAITILGFITPILFALHRASK